MVTDVYDLVNRGQVKLDWNNVEAAIPRWDGIRGHHTLVIMVSGNRYLLKGQHSVRY